LIISLIADHDIGAIRDSPTTREKLDHKEILILILPSTTRSAWIEALLGQVEAHKSVEIQSCCVWRSDEAQSHANSTGQYCTTVSSTSWISLHILLRFQISQALLYFQG
jgi:hypothetical protein